MYLFTFYTHSLILSFAIFSKETEKQKQKQKKNEQNNLFFSQKYIVNNIRCKKPSRGGLEVERWSDNGLHFTSVDLNPL